MRCVFPTAALLLAACADPPPAEAPASDSQSASAVDPSAYEPDLPDQGAEDGLDVDQLSLGLDGIIIYLHHLDPLPWHEIWDDEFWGNASDDCPELQLHNGMHYWNDRCTSASGAEYRGWSLNLRGGDWDEGPGVYMRTFAWLSGHAVITLPDGVVLENFGDVMYQHVDEDRGGATIEAFQGFVYGDFSFSGPAGEGDWMQAPVTNETYFRYELQPDGSHAALLDGALAWFDGPVVAARLEDLRLTDSPGACPHEPTGDILLRDTEGGWTTVAFGAPSPADPACDGCGDATRGGEDLGVVCADFSPLLAWPDGRPWGR
jgi:hypothetical protein